MPWAVRSGEAYCCKKSFDNTRICAGEPGLTVHRKGIALIMNSINDIRAQIDMIDSDIISLLEKRFAITDSIGLAKHKENKNIVDSIREKQKLDNLFGRCSKEYAGYIAAIFKALMEESKLSQSRVLFGPETIFFVGMPGCGKTTVARELSELIYADVIDLDNEFSRMYIATPEMFINQMGEELFRKNESLVLKLVIERIAGLRANYFNKRVVISCGGGAVCREINIERMKESGKIVYVKRDLNKLETNGRPISVAKGVENLYNERRALYEGCADYIVENNDVRECAAAIAGLLYESTCK